MTVKFTQGWKYQLVERWEYQTKEAFDFVGTLLPYTNPDGWYGVNSNGAIWAARGCCWNGANCFPDFDWVMEGSLGHDILHWLIADGVIPEYQNHLIDKEIENIILERAPRPPLFKDKSLIVMARTVRRGTNLATQKKGVTAHRKIRTITRKKA